MKMRHIAMAVAVALSSSYAMADTSSAVRGRISTPEGAAAAGTKVVILHVPSGTSRTVTTNDSGSFVVSGLRVGGPYKIIVDSETYADETVNDVFLQLGDTFQLNRQLKTAEQVERIAVTGTAIASQTTGSSSTFDQELIENAPAFNRDLKDIVRNNPLAVVSEDNQLSIAGANSRFNSFTIDGIGQNDDFGLNSSGYPTQRSPISLDAISQISVDVTPFTAKAGGFSGGLVNAVTKSGTNDVAGSFFYEMTNNSLAGNAKSKRISNNRTFEVSDSYTFGGTLGGAVVEDKLFYFVSYENFKQETPTPFGVGSGSNPSLVTQAQVDTVLKTLKDTYGITDSLGSDPEDTDEKILLKIDWNINDLHRADFTYQFQNNLEGRNFSDSNSTIVLKSRAYDYKTITSNFAGHLFSDWTDEFSTEVSFAYKDVKAESLLNSFNAAYSIQTPTGRINGGTDVFRHANVADNVNFKLGVDATYLMDEHTLNFGYEVERLNLFNLFAESSLGSWTFDNTNSGAVSGMTNFAQKKPTAFDYKNAPSNKIEDTTVDLTRTTHVLYVEDEFSPIDDVDVTAGLRYERLATNDIPTLSPAFQKQYGFANTEAMDGLDVVLPRLGVKWYLTESTTLRGGVGLFTGGQPNVWVTNSYTNNGMTFVQAPKSVRDQTLTNTANVDFNSVPQFVKDSLKPGGFTNYTDPNFKLPTDLRYQLAADFNFEIPFLGDDFNSTLDATLIQRRDPAVWLDTSRVPSGKKAADGRIIYKSIYSGDLKDNYDIMLTNGEESETTRILSASLAKTWETGIRMTTSYTNQDSEEANPGTSSRAVSNYGNNPVLDRNVNIIAPAVNETKHRLVLNLGYSTEFFSGYATKFDLFFERKSGRPLSYVLDSNRDFAFGDQTDLGSNDVYLPYIPTSATDPVMKFGNGKTGYTYEQIMEVFRTVGLDKYAGGHAPKNAFYQPWTTTMDLNVQQEIPGFSPEHKGTLYFTVLNLANLLDKDSGQVHRMRFPQQPLMQFSVDSTTGQYTYEPLSSSSTLLQNARNWSEFYPSASVWRIKVGVNYRF